MFAAPSTAKGKTNRMRARIPPWAWLAGIVLVSAVVRYVFGRRIVAPWIFVDELIYSELAKSLAVSGELAVRGASAGGAYGIVYPLLIAPAWLVFDAVPDAYAAAKAINSIVMSVAAIPTYVLARLVLGSAPALVAAAFAVAVPSLAYSGTLMTENAFYPLFLVVALALVAYLEAPSPLRAGLLGAAVLAAFATRAQALALVPAILTAPLLLAGVRGRGLAAFRDIYWLVAGGLGLVLAVQLVRGASLRDLLGAYEPVSDRGYDVGQTVRWAGYHLAELDLYVGGVPLLALLLVVIRARALTPAGQAFAAAAVALVGWMLVAVAMFASEVPEPPRIMERNLFHVVPLLVIALLVWLDLGAPRRRRRALAAAAVVAALPLALPFDRFLVSDATADTLALLPWWRLVDAGLDVAVLPVLAAAVAGAAAGLALLVPGRGLLVVTAAAFVVTTAFAQFGARGMETAARDALEAGIGAAHNDWIDRAVGRDAEVAVVWSGHQRPQTVWQNEFFNRSVGPVLRRETPLPGDLREELLAGASAPFALSDGTAPVAGARVAVDERHGLVLTRTAGPITLIGSVTGLYPGDTWSGPRVEYRLERCPANATLDVLVRSDARLLGRPQTVDAGPMRVEVPPGASRELRIALPRADGACRAAFEIAPTGRAGADPRELGLHFERFLLRS